MAFLLVRRRTREVIGRPVGYPDHVVGDERRIFRSPLIRMFRYRRRPAGSRLIGCGC